MVKADDKVVFDENDPEEFTEFEYLKARMHEMEKVVDTHTDILQENNLVINKEIRASYIDEDEVFRALAGE